MSDAARAKDDMMDEPSKRKGTGPVAETRLRGPVASLGTRDRVRALLLDLGLDPTDGRFALRLRVVTDVLDAFAAEQMVAKDAEIARLGSGYDLALQGLRAAEQREAGLRALVGKMRTFIEQRHTVPPDGTYGRICRLCAAAPDEHADGCLLADPGAQRAGEEWRAIIEAAQFVHDHNKGAIGAPALCAALAPFAAVERARGAK